MIGKSSMDTFAPPRRTALYRLFGASQQLLYVGVAYDPVIRLKQHRKAPWWPQVVSRRVEWFSDRPTAEAAETTAIQTELPLHNITDHPFNKPQPPKRYNRTNPAHAMTAARYRIVRESLGLTGDWLATYLGVHPRTARTWEQGKYLVPESVRLEIEDLATQTAEIVASAVKKLAGSGKQWIAVYRTDDQYHAAHPEIGFPASWHRAVVARVALEVPALRIAYSPTPGEAEE